MKHITMEEYVNMFENEVEPSTIMADHMIDCHMINRQDEEDSEEEARG